MRYLTLTLLIASYAATNVHCMDSKEKKELDLKAHFATISWLQNTPAQELKLIGFSPEAQTEVCKAQLKQAVLGVLPAVTLESPGTDATTITVCINAENLVPLFQVMKQLEQEKKQKEDAIERAHHANITYLLEFEGIQTGFDYCREQQLPTWKYLPAICLAIGETR